MLVYNSKFLFLFFFNDTATTEIYTLSLHDALPISAPTSPAAPPPVGLPPVEDMPRSEEHTSELQSRENLVCRLLLEKKKKYIHPINLTIRTKITLAIPIDYALK